MSVKYCNAVCQKLRAAELRDEALFKDPPPKEDCPICFLPMPTKLICCLSLPPATIASVPIYDFFIAYPGLEFKSTKQYYPCCGKSVCQGCDYSICKTGNARKCPFCNADRGNKTGDEMVDEVMNRVEANDPASICLLANSYHHGLHGIQQDLTTAMELYARAADLGFSKAHCQLANIYHKGGDTKKAKIHAMAGHEVARYNIGVMENNSGNIERAIKHWTIAASAGHYFAMHDLITFFKKGLVSRDTIDSILTAYNKSCVEMRSEARDSYIRAITI